MSLGLLSGIAARDLASRVQTINPPLRESTGNCPSPNSGGRSPRAPRAGFASARALTTAGDTLEFPGFGHEGGSLSLQSVETVWHSGFRRRRLEPGKRGGGLRASCKPNLALPSHVDRSGLGRGRAWETPEAAAAARGPDRRPERSPPLPDAALKLAGLRKSARAGREPLGSVSGRRRALTERMAVPRRIRVGGTVGRRGRSPAGDRAEPPISSKGAGLERPLLQLESDQPFALEGESPSAFVSSEGCCSTGIQARARMARLLGSNPALPLNGCVSLG
ncbi:uncharacterized protein [Macaca nemestrina]|uniref:uncharacterized protein n=1 Tax=Macaca nemestrina TaxID=9545 RepID=UPI0039B83951